VSAPAQVWILTEIIEYEGARILGVFATREAARQPFIDEVMVHKDSRRLDPGQLFDETADGRGNGSVQVQVNLITAIALDPHPVIGGEP
jgi:hypothetical protein